MALFNTLKQILTPYANKINLHTGEIEEIQSDVSEVKTDLVSKVDTSLMQKCVLIKTEPINRWDAANVTSGLLHTNGTVYTGDSYDNYCYSSIGEVQEGDVVTSYRLSAYVITTENMMRVVAFDSDGNVMPDSGVINTATYTVPAGVASLKVTMTKTVSASSFMVLVNADSAPTAYIPYEESTEYYVGSKEFIGEINLSDTDFDTKYLDYSMVNRLDPAECVVGKFLNAVTGQMSDNASYFTTGYMPIRAGEALYLYRTRTLESATMRTIAAYDADKNIIAEYGNNSGSESVVYRERMAYIRASIVLSDSIPQKPETVMVVNNNSPITTPSYGNEPVLKSDYIRKKIYVYASDSEANVIQKMVDAYNTTNCDVIFERATYTFGTVLPQIITLYGFRNCEIPIGNDCRYFFNGATLTATIDLSTLGADFNCNLLGSQYKPTNYELHDGILKATDTRYVVHDEAATLTGSYKHLYQNMIMEYHTNVSTDAYRKCIGGGTGASGVIEIVGCKFTTDGTEVDVSFHGNAYDIAGAEFMVNVRNCWFSNGFRAGELSASQTGKLIFAGNSLGWALQTFTRWDVTSFLNEVRS